MEYFNLKNKKISNKKAFTLLELLIVIAIIGVLASIVMSSLNSSRQKSRIANIQSTMKSFLNEVSIITNGENTTNGYLYGICPNTTATASTTILTNDKLMLMLNTARSQGGGQAYCTFNVDGTKKWVFSVDLPNKTTVLCVDWKGATKILPGGETYGTYGDAMDVANLSCK
jgi:prepilin-type N-terminal cleavage/methylation domain-containing protein